MALSATTFNNNILLQSFKPRQLEFEDLTYNSLDFEKFLYESGYQTNHSGQTAIGSKRMHY